jgi:hypothetical protein
MKKASPAAPSFIRKGVSTSFTYTDTWEKEKREEKKEEQSSSYLGSKRADDLHLSKPHVERCTLVLGSIRIPDHHNVHCSTKKKKEKENETSLNNSPSSQKLFQAYLSVEALTPMA